MASSELNWSAAVFLETAFMFEEEEKEAGMKMHSACPTQFIPNFNHG